MEKNKRIQTMSKDMDSLDDKYRVLGEAHNQVLASVEILNDQLKEERRKLVDMETLTKTLENERGKNAEVNREFEGKTPLNNKNDLIPDFSF